MATLARAPETAAHTRSPLALWHLLSLDAPTVAALWTWFIAGSAHVRVPLLSAASMFLAVWLLYAADRLLDARLLDARPLDPDPLRTQPDLEARHRFHARHRTAFLTGIGLVAVALAALLPAIPPAALHLDLALGAVLAAYFILIHATPAAHRLPKELAVGIFFAAAVFIPTVARAPALRLALLPSAVLLGALCSLNCLDIYRWEHFVSPVPATHLRPATVPALTGHPAGAAQPHAATRLALEHLRALHLALIAAALTLALLTRQPLALAIALAAAALLLLDHLRPRLSRLHLRAAADLALTTPILIAPFLHLHR